MLYPMKFEPIFKEYIWGGRNLEKLGKKLMGRIAAESWELSCHRDGMSIVQNGAFQGKTLQSLVDAFGYKITGNAQKGPFPLLVKLIDANERLSVQVHPNDAYALVHEGETGKNEMWYILDAKPGAHLIYDVKPGVRRESFEKAALEDRVEDCLETVPVQAGDFLIIPAGVVHAVGEGIVLAEIQQSSNSTYRIFDYHRTDAYGNERQLHLNKAMEVIRFDSEKRRKRYSGLRYEISQACSAVVLAANRHFCVELLQNSGEVDLNTLNRQFHIQLCIEGNGMVTWDGGSLEFQRGETFLIPAGLQAYRLYGKFSSLMAWVPDLQIDIFQRLQHMGFTTEQLLESIGGLVDVE